MRKLLYFLRVLVISYEFLAVMSIFMIYLLWGQVLLEWISKKKLNESAVEWFVLYPLGVAAWSLKDAATVVLFPESGAKVLHEWSGYWKLRVHFDVGIIFIVSSALFCSGVWLLDLVSEPLGVFLLLATMLISSIAAWSFNQAGLVIKEAMLRLQSE